MRPIEKMESGLGTLEAARPEPASIWVKARYPWWVRLINRTGAVLGRAGLGRVRIDPDAMMAEARRRTGLADFGDGRFRAGLDALVESFEQEGTAHTFGRIFFREFLHRPARQPVKDPAGAEGASRDARSPPGAALDRDGVPPERDHAPAPGVVRRPGRTHAALLGDDRAGPRPPRVVPDRPEDRPARRQIRLLYTIAPQIPSAHHYEAEEPEECNNLFAHEFAAGFIGFMFDVPGYVRWLSVQDYVPGYRSMKRQLQILSRNVRADYWVLKAPGHLFALDALLTVYPDASVVQVHRDPLKVIPSGCNLSAAFRSLTVDPVDRARLGAEFVKAMAVGPERAMKVRVGRLRAVLRRQVRIARGRPGWYRPHRLRALRVRLHARIRGPGAPVRRREPPAQARRSPLQARRLRSRRRHRQPRVRGLQRLGRGTPRPAPIQCRGEPPAVEAAHRTLRTLAVLAEQRGDQAAPTALQDGPPRLTRGP